MSADDRKKTSAKKIANKPGHDPLAWINEDESKTETHTVDSAVAVTAKASGSKVLNLPVYFGIAQANDVCSDMRNILASDCSVVQIAGGDVESCDTAAVQLILAFNRQAKKVGKDVEWLACSQKISDMGGLLGVNM